MCGQESSAEQAIEAALETHFETEIYIAGIDGSSQPVQVCPECGLKAYVLMGEEFGCVWCASVLEECLRCNIGLTPENVSPDYHSLCSYCAHVMSKDD